MRVDDGRRCRRSRRTMSASTHLDTRGATDIYTRLASGLLFPLHERIKRHSTVAVRRWLEKTEWYSQRELVERAAGQLPYYRDLFAGAGIEPSSIRGPADLARIPFLTKPLIRSAG